MLLVTPARACGLTAREPTAATPPAPTISSSAYAASLERRHCRCAELWAARCHCQPCCQVWGTCTTGHPACRMPPLNCQGAGSSLDTAAARTFPLLAGAGAGASSCRRPPGPPAACQEWPSIASCPPGGRLRRSRAWCACGRSAGSSSYFLLASASAGPWARSEEAALGALRV